MPGWMKSVGRDDVRSREAARLIAWGLCACGLFTAAGCSSIDQASGEPQSAQDPEAQIVQLDPRGVDVIDGYTGSRTEWAALVEASSQADVVIIGEMHGHSQGLATAAALWEDVIERVSGNPSLSLEFFTRDEQAGLDDYLLGITDEDAFREATGRTEGNYPQGHRAMLEAAREAGLRVHAANAPRRYTTLARMKGYGELELLRASQSALVVTPGESREGPYRDRFFDVFRGMMMSHGGADQDPAALEEKIEGYYRAQSVWDATMADSVSNALAQGQRPVVHVVGQFHSDHRGGLVEAIWRVRPGTRVLTVSMVENPDVGGEDRGRADFVIDVGAPAN